MPPAGSAKTGRKTLLSMREAEELAQADGFENFDAMLAWFDKTHGLPFKEFLVEWVLV